jgi:uncharacterized protein YfaS (alpha-2-macroglobulin family)
MKQSLLLLAMLWPAIGLLAQPNYDYNRQWSKVDSLLDKDQVQQARKIVASISLEASREKNVPQFIKATIYQILVGFDDKVNVDSEEESYKNLFAQMHHILAQAPFPTRNILHSLMAELYWIYYTDFSWEIGRRTHVEKASDDFLTWDKQRLVEQIIAHYKASLDGAEQLQNLPIEQYNDMLIRRAAADQYRPTLYDFLAFRAIDFYRKEKNSILLAQPIDPFIVTGDTWLVPAGEFVAMPLTTADTLSFTVQALRLMQQVIAFHLPDTNPTALLDADLQRLLYVHAQLPAGGERDTLLQEALYALEAQYATCPVSTEIQYHIANIHRRAGKQEETNKALAIIDTAVARFPESLGAENCLVLKSQILEPALSMQMDEAVLPQKPILALVQYKNIEEVYYRIIPIDYTSTLALAQQNTQRRSAFLREQKAIKTGLWTLPKVGDYQSHTVEVALPALPEGYYAIALSTDDTFADTTTIMHEQRLWVSTISYVQQVAGDTAMFLLRHRETGQPLKGISAQVYSRIYNYDKDTYTIRLHEVYAANAEGLIKVPARERHNRSVGLLFGKRQGKEEKLDALLYASPENIYLSRYANSKEPSSYLVTELFTDRAIYRPGQTVYFKGITFRQQGNRSEVVKDRTQTVSLHNVNREEVAKVSVVTNEYGAFFGSFVLPVSGLTGRWHIQASPENTGHESFLVEEYKRPKFEARFEPVTGSYRLGDTVAVKGKAMAYAGNAVTQAKVTWRVVREARYPRWRWWWPQMPSSPAQEIGTGETLTGEDGSFRIAFPATPDLGANRQASPVFYYRLSAVISDVNGETHEIHTSVPVGYSSLLLSTNAPKETSLEAWEKITITATNLSEQPQPVQGTLSIRKLRAPNRLLHERRWPCPDQYLLSRKEFEGLFPHHPYGDENNPLQWEQEAEVFSLAFDTQVATSYALPDRSRWAAGKYLVTVSAQDAAGEPLTDTMLVTASAASSKAAPENEPFRFTVLTPVVQPGEVAKVVVGTGFSQVQVVLETMEDQYKVSSQTFTLNREQRILEIPVKESYRGNFGVNLFFVRHNRFYSAQQVIRVPFSNKELVISFATFRHKLQPGQEEEWQLTIKNKAGDAVAAEMLASMYDASLDAFTPHQWRFAPWQNNMLYFRWRSAPAFKTQQSQQCLFNYEIDKLGSRSYSELLSIDPYIYRNKYIIMDARIMEEVVVSGYASHNSLAEQRMMKKSEEDSAPEEIMAVEDEDTAVAAPAEEAPPVQIRTNFNETAFFYPQLRTNAQGETVISFTLPEALTRWKMQGLAWTTDLQTGYVQRELVAQKDLMILSNPPRFFREDDEMLFSAKLSNLSDSTLTVAAQVQFFDAFTQKPLALTTAPEQTLVLLAGDNKPVGWKIAIPEGIQAITYRITAISPSFSDGEESTLPVLSNRMLVTESLPLHIGRNQTKTYRFTKLLQSKSPSLRHQSFTLTFTSNPAWEALQALPYIMEYPFECTEQAFSRYYANTIATYIVDHDPKVKQVFDIWQKYQPEALRSNLEKNEALRQVLLEETPWVREARDETERKHRLAVLFDLNRMHKELDAALHKVQQAQTPDGGFSWFRGGPNSPYITQHVVAGVGHLEKMGIRHTVPQELLSQAIRYMDKHMAEAFAKLKAQAAEKKVDYTKENHLEYMLIHYLYARSFFLEKYPLPGDKEEAFGFYKTQATTYWPKRSPYLKGMLALTLHRQGDTTTARLIMKSLSETAIRSEELGMYWRNQPRGWWWYQAPVETQALLIEAYHEILNDSLSVDALKTALLKSKQTAHWPSTKATSEAIYALLLTGSKLLESDELCEITVGTHTIDPQQLEGPNRPEAGTGHFQVSWHGSEVQPDMGRITVKNPKPTIAWGAAFWQYFERLDKITPAETGVSIRKQLLLKTHSPAGPVLKEITAKQALKVGDKVTVRIEIRADRNMEYVHLKDMRAAAFEPLNVLSRYRWQDGLGYYESTRDAATHFFIDYLPKGTYVFEYDLFATQQGTFSNGITTLQCMYAPEFAAHSESLQVTVE